MQKVFDYRSIHTFLHKIYPLKYDFTSSYKNTYIIEIDKFDLQKIFNNPNNLENSNYISPVIKIDIFKNIEFKYIYAYKIVINEIEYKETLEVYANKKIPEIKYIIERIGFIIRYVLEKKKILDIKLPKITIYYSKEKKYYPEDKVFTPNNVNSAITDGKRIIIFRQEELLKSVIHELLHFYDFDDVLNNYPLKMQEEIIERYGINVDKINVNEAFIEALANVLNILCNIGNRKLLLRDLRYFMMDELDYSIDTAANIMKHIGRKKMEEKQFPFNDTSNTFSYYILKTAILYNFAEFLYVINDSTKYKYTNLFLRCYLDESYNVEILHKYIMESMIKLQSIINMRLARDFRYYDNTLRMTINDKFYIQVNKNKDITKKIV